MTTNAVPNPGSDEAIAAGCTCPVLDNAHGKGYYGKAGVFVYTVGCPVHDPGRLAIQSKAGQAMTKLTTQPNMRWLRLTPKQTRVLLMAWRSSRIVVRGWDLNHAHRLARRGLLRFIRPIEGGMQGEFALSEDARAYPPTGLKALVIPPAPAGRLALKSMEDQQ